MMTKFAVMYWSTVFCKLVTRLDSDNDEVSFGEKYELLGRAAGGT